MTDDQATTPPVEGDPREAGTDLGQGNDAEDREFLQEARRQVEALAESGEDKELFLALLARHLLPAVTPDTFGRLVDSAGMLLGREGFWPLMEIAHESPRDRPAAIAETEYSPAAQELLREVVGLYGYELAVVWDTWKGNRRGKDWRSVDNEIHRDIDGGQYWITLDFERTDGETFTLRGDPDSIVRLARLLLRVATRVGDADAFDRETSDRFLAAVEEFQQAVGPSQTRTDA